jgi:hypothetical protein
VIDSTDAERRSNSEGDDNMDHVDLIGLAGLLVGLIALFVAVYGIRDVREQVKFLVTLERNLVFAREVRTEALQLVELVDGAARFQSSEMHGLSMLARAIDPKQTLESVQEYTNKESLMLAQDIVNRGLAKWCSHIDGNRVSEVLRAWQNDKNAAALRKIFGDPQLAEPSKDLMS